MSVHSILETVYVHVNSNIILKNHYPELFKTSLNYLSSKEKWLQLLLRPWDGCHNILEDFCINNKKNWENNKNIFLRHHLMIMLIDLIKN